MKPLFLDEIRDCIGARTLAASAAISLAGVCTDTRTLQRGELFFALRGERFDGHTFVAEAMARGAGAAVVDHLPDGFSNEHQYRSRILMVDDTVRALGRLASYYRDELACTIIAVTGSNGKTTTREMIYHILRSRHRGRRSKKSFNNHIGVPLTLLAASPADEFLVVEVGSNSPGEIDYLGNIIRPDIAVITCIGESHLEGFGTIERIAGEKASLTAHVRPGGAIVVNADRPLLMRLISHPQALILGFGLAEGSDLRMTSLTATADGIDFVVNDRFEFHLPVLGRHNAMNCLAAIAVARRMGLEMSEIAGLLTDFQLPAMRLQIERIGSFVVVNDAYNANPVSMLAALEAFEAMAARGRRVFFCGEMRELGAAAEKYHRQLGRRIACSGVEVLVAVGEYAAAVIKEAISAGLSENNVRSYQNTADAAEHLNAIIREGDSILVKGSRAMGMEVLIDQLRTLTRTES